MPKSQPESDEQADLIAGGKVMSLFEHLDELRRVLVISISAVFVLFVIAATFANHLIEILKVPLMQALPEGQKTLHFTGPMDVFVAGLKVAMLAAVIGAMPIWSYQFWKFFEPALYPRERRMILPFAMASISLFCAGVAFCYFVMLPMTLTFLIGLGLEVGTPLITINDYISLVGILLLAFGLVFETPVVLILLAKLDLIDAQFLIKHRSLSIVIILIIAAVLTPPDPISQLAMAAPMYVMFEASILLMRFFGSSSRENQENGK